MPYVLRLSLYFMALGSLVLLSSCADAGNDWPETLPAQGSIGFWFRTTAAYWNGPAPEGDALALVTIPGVANIYLRSSKTQVQMGWRWDAAVTGVAGLEFQMPHLPGPAWYYCAFRWDSAAGRFNGFLNGAPMRELHTPIPPWTLPAAPTDSITTGAGVTDLEITGDFWSETNIQHRLAQHDAPNVSELVGYGARRAMGDIASLTGNLLYAPDLGGDLAGWRMEGPGVVEQNGNWMTMWSQEAEDGPNRTGHIVHWLPVDVPESFIAEWEFQVLSEYGLCIVFFSATGRNGEDIFSPSLSPREGIFAQYHSGDLNNYHCSYYADTPSAPGRNTANLRKNYGFHVVANGPPGITGTSLGEHRVTLIKDGSHILLGVDGRVCIDWTDNGQRYGPALGAGKMGLRQMKWTKARYRNLKIWALR